MEAGVILPCCQQLNPIITFFPLRTARMKHQPVDPGDWETRPDRSLAFASPLFGLHALAGAVVEPLSGTTLSSPRRRRPMKKRHGSMFQKYLSVVGTKQTGSHKRRWLQGCRRRPPCAWMASSLVLFPFFVYYLSVMNGSASRPRARSRVVMEVHAKLPPLIKTTTWVEIRVCTVENAGKPLIDRKEQYLHEGNDKKVERQNNSHLGHWAERLCDKQTHSYYPRLPWGLGYEEALSPAC
ncbi:hypothetical protein J3F83DRAFT_515760 [Trichoderma novae-zelandiae]